MFRQVGQPQRDLNAGKTYVYHGQTLAPFRVQKYYWPANMHYYRYGIGASLPLAFLIAEYRLMNWSAYGLIAPPDGYTWVRYGPDMLLVEQDTGQIGDTVYGALVETGDSDAASPDDGSN